MNEEPFEIERGWLSSITRVDSPNYDARPPGTEIDLVVIHSISLPPGTFGGPYIKQLFLNQLEMGAHEYFEKIASSRVSAHFLVGRAGQLTQFVRIEDRAWHAGESLWQGRVACNDFSLGIEVEGTDQIPYTDEQYTELCRLVKTLLEYLPHVTPNRIVGHCDVASGRKTDPGPYFDWDRLRTDLAL